MCTGTIISEHHVLTAAHCLHDGPHIPEAVWILTRIENMPNLYGVHRTIHPHYNRYYSSGNHDNDIAIITVEDTMKIPPALLAANYTQPDANLLRVAGFVSKKAEPASVKYIFMETHAFGYSKGSCSILPSILNGICILYPKAATLPEDGSEPSFAFGKDGKYYQVGITSFGLPLSDVGFVSLSTHVSHYCPWIEETTGGKVKCQTFELTEIEIENGKIVPSIDLPYVVKLQSNYQNAIGTCTGTIISKHHVLTAAHCLNNRPIAVKIHTRVNNQSFDAAHWTIHSGYPGDFADHDVGIITVQQPMKIRPAILAANYTHKKYDWLRIAGYGKTKYEFKDGAAVHTEPAENLMETYMQGVALRDPEMIDNELRRLNPNVNGIYLYHETGVLEGDSGGPSFALGKDGEWYQVGVSSLGGPIGNNLMMAIVTDVSYYCSWIEQTTGGEVKCHELTGWSRRLIGSYGGMDSIDGYPLSNSFGYGAKPDLNNVVVFLTRNQDNLTSHAWCTGTIVSEHYILTAAQCLPPTPGLVQIYTRDAYRYDGSKFSTPAFELELEAYIHPEYCKKNSHNIGLIKVSKPMGIPPTPLAANYSHPKDDLLRVAGYGNTKYQIFNASANNMTSSEFPKTLMETYLQARSKDDCFSASLKIDYPGWHAICMYKHDSTILPGDHGGPAFAQGKDGKFYQVGVNGYVFTSESSLPYLSWEMPFQSPCTLACKFQS
uniref:Peptidase S1 domain-containing protein n=1 Tax=Panagrolaimus sp. JU765 TaxID=591449 RepID=A0AC34RNH5_9BILA